MLTNPSLNIGTPWPENMATPALPPAEGATEFAATMLSLAATPEIQHVAAAPEPMRFTKPMVMSLPAQAPAALSDANMESAAAISAAAVPHGLQIDSDAAKSQLDNSESEVDIMASLAVDFALAVAPASVVSDQPLLPPVVATHAVPEKDAVNEAASAVPSLHLHSSSVRWLPTVEKNSNVRVNEVPSGATAGIVSASDGLFGVDYDMTRSGEVATRSEPTLAVSFTASPMTVNSTGAAIMQPSLTPERQLDLTNDARWLGELANDIALASSDEGILNFRVLPKQLGRIEVSIEPGATGLIIQVATETEAARAMLIAANPRLLSELGQSGVSVENATYGNLGQQDAGGGQPRREQQNAPSPHAFANQPTRPQPSERGTSVPSRLGRFA